MKSIVECLKNSLNESRFDNYDNIIYEIQMWILRNKKALEEIKANWENSFKDDVPDWVETIDKYNGWKEICKKLHATEKEVQDALDTWNDEITTEIGREIFNY